MAFITQWELCVRAHERVVTTEEYAAWSPQSRATTYNRLRDFRMMFPQLGDDGLPSDLMGPLVARLGAGQPAPEDFDLGAVT
jgi:hypothetical protein